MIKSVGQYSMHVFCQATIPGFLSKGLSIEEGESLLKKSVALAVEARNSFWESVKVSPEHHLYNRALVAASIGSYGAYLADGSEYR
jgi:homocysteine S-methyltransferase